MENNELQSLIDELRGKLPKDTTVELIDFDEVAATQQGQPGQTLPDELIAMLSRAAEEAAREVFGDALGTVQTEIISPIDDSPEAAQAMREMLRSRFGMQRAQCYHYVLRNGQPVHTEDGEEIEAFQARNGHILANKRFNCLGLKMQVTTGFIVHNTWNGGEPPAPCWATQVIREDDEEVGFQQITYSAADAMRVHRFACAQTQHVIAQLYRQRRPSPTRRAKAQRRIAAGQDVLRRKPQRESNDHWMRRMLKEAFGGMEGPQVARTLGLPDLRKRGQQ